MDRSNADTKPSAINRLACGTEGARRNASSCGTGRLASRILVCADLFMFNIFKGTVVPGAREGTLYHTRPGGKLTTMLSCSSYLPSGPKDSDSLRRSILTGSKPVAAVV
jgi:hypothetical protein